jgi:hypothetical protein
VLVGEKYVLVSVCHFSRCKAPALRTDQSTLRLRLPCARSATRHGCDESPSPARRASVNCWPYTYTNIRCVSSPLPLYSGPSPAATSRSLPLRPNPCVGATEATPDYSWFAVKRVEMSGPRRPQGPRISTDVHGQNLSKPPYRYVIVIHKSHVDTAWIALQPRRLS